MLPTLQNATQAVQAGGRARGQKLLAQVGLVGASALVLALGALAALFLPFAPGEILMPGYVPEDVGSLLAMGYVSPEEIRSMAHTARQAVEQFHPSPYAMSEHEIALREYWANADAARFMGYVEVRAPDGGEPALQKKRAVMLFEYEGEALQEMAADEKTRYVEARLRPRQDLPGGWELVDFREMLSDEVALLPAWQCTNCLLLAAPSSDLSTCTAYWGLERDARESGDAGAGTCAWRTMP